MVNWKEKLTSRKFWVAVSTILVGIVALFTRSDEVAGTIIMITSTIAYIMGETYVDANREELKEDGKK